MLGADVGEATERDPEYDSYVPLMEALSALFGGGCSSCFEKGLTEFGGNEAWQPNFKELQALGPLELPALNMSCPTKLCKPSLKGLG